jgi:hypothetical protein
MRRWQLAQFLSWSNTRLMRPAVFGRRSTAQPKRTHEAEAAREDAHGEMSAPQRNSSAVQQSHLLQRLPRYFRVYWMSEQLVYLMHGRGKLPLAQQIFEDHLPFPVARLCKLACNLNAGWGLVLCVF